MADAFDSKSNVREDVPVRVRPPAPSEREGLYGSNRTALLFERGSLWRPARMISPSDTVGTFSTGTVSLTDEF